MWQNYNSGKPDAADLRLTVTAVVFSAAISAAATIDFKIGAALSLSFLLAAAAMLAHRSRQLPAFDQSAVVVLVLSLIHI